MEKLNGDPMPTVHGKQRRRDDTLPEGAMIRTGLKSSLTLRVGLNATVLIDSNARVTIPRIVHDGQQLETAVKVARGRADIQVNHVGLTNDFSVVTPSGALAVKGTGFACRYDEFNGTSIVGSRKNTINAIEVHYYATKLAYYLSGGAISSSTNENPTLAALIEAAPSTVSQQGRTTRRGRSGNFARRGYCQHGCRDPNRPSRSCHSS